jgi:hypothetical protein
MKDGLGQSLMKQKPLSPKESEREARMAEALRANLRRRKEQQAARASCDSAKTRTENEG